jgi:hypothetical protein
VEGGARRPGEGAQAAAEEGDSGEGGRVGGGYTNDTAESRTVGRTDRQEGMQAARL